MNHKIFDLKLVLTLVLLNPTTLSGCKTTGDASLSESASIEQYGVTAVVGGWLQNIGGRQYIDIAKDVYTMNRSGGYNNSPGLQRIYITGLRNDVGNFYAELRGRLERGRGDALQMDRPSFKHIGNPLNYLTIVVRGKVESTLSIAAMPSTGVAIVATGGEAFELKGNERTILREAGNDYWIVSGLLHFEEYRLLNGDVFGRRQIIVVRTDARSGEQ